VYVAADPIGIVGGCNPYRYVTDAWNWVDRCGLNGEPPCGHLVRFIPKDSTGETAAKLAEDAARAETKGFGHGVSTMLKDKISGSDKRNLSALYEDAAKVFNIRKTGSNPKHYTVDVPKPVTQEVADLFNSVFSA